MRGLGDAPKSDPLAPCKGQAVKAADDGMRRGAALTIACLRNKASARASASASATDFQ
jgi:hypothetical protein